MNIKSNDFHNLISKFTVENDKTLEEKQTNNTIYNIDADITEEILFKKPINKIISQGIEQKSYHGHRARAKERFLSNDDKSKISDRDLLELILFYHIPRSDVTPLVDKLLNTFHDISNISKATKNEIETIGINYESINLFFKLTKEINGRLIRNKLKKQKVFDDWNNIINYLYHNIGNENIEIFTALYLDSHYKLIADIKLGHGTVDEVTIYSRDVVKHAIDLGAKFLIISHNHPSGKLEPSIQDIKLTEKINESMKHIGVILLDHIIVGNQKYYSFKENLLL